MTKRMRALGSVAAVTSLMTFATVALGTDAAGLASRSLSFRYDVEVTKIAPTSKELALWLPVPPTTPEQAITNLTIESDLPYSIETDAEYGNRILYVHGTEKLPETVKVGLHFDVTRKVVERLHGASSAAVERDPMIRRFLAPDRLVPLDGIVATEAKLAGGTEKDPLARAHALYEHVVKTVTYDKTGEGWGRGDVLYACDARKGNCTDFHALFIGLARTSALPARFIMGFPVPPDPAGTIAGYHCWAEFYVDGKGWIPVDASEASKDKSRTEALFGGLDPNRVAFTLGRDIVLPHGPAEPVNFLIYPYVLVDGKPHVDVQRKVSYADRSEG